MARRLAMLDAALAVFGEKGFEGATLDEIAERAEFGKGTLYNYFPGGKDELYLSLFEERVAAGLLDIAHGTLPDDRAVGTRAEARAAFYDFILGLLEYFEANRSVLRLFMMEGARALHDPDRMADVFRLFADFTQVVERALERAMDQDALRRLPPTPVAHLLIGNVRGLLMAHAASDCVPAGAPEMPPLVPAETAEFITTALFDGLLAPPAGAPSSDA